MRDYNIAVSLGDETGEWFGIRRSSVEVGYMPNGRKEQC